MLNRPLVLIICLMTGIGLVIVGHSVTAKPECRDVHGRLDSVAAELDGDSETLETVGTLRGGIHADFEFRSFTPVPTNVPLENVQFYTATSTYTLRDGSIVKGINTGVFDGRTGEVTEFTTFTTDGVHGDLGRIIVSGAFDLMAGVGKSRYRGHVCF
jgi:hypothetical protein